MEKRLLTQAHATDSYRSGKNLSTWQHFTAELLAWNSVNIYPMCWSLTFGLLLVAESGTSLRPSQGECVVWPEADWSLASPANTPEASAPKSACASLGWTTWISSSSWRQWGGWVWFSGVVCTYPIFTSGMWSVSLGRQNSLVLPLKQRPPRHCFQVFWHHHCCPSLQELTTAHWG